MEMNYEHQMMDMITEHPEVMKMCMQKMKEKGMMQSGEKMINPDKKSNHNH